MALNRGAAMSDQFYMNGQSASREAGDEGAGFAAIAGLVVLTGAVVVWAMAGPLLAGWAELLPL
jgi:hypothetical protein